MATERVWRSSAAGIGAPGLVKKRVSSLLGFVSGMPAWLTNVRPVVPVSVMGAFGDGSGSEAACVVGNRETCKKSRSEQIQNIVDQDLRESNGKSWAGTAGFS